MPKVAGKTFSYDKAGRKAATKYAKKTGQPVKTPAVYKKPRKKVTTK